MARGPSWGLAEHVEEHIEECLTCLTCLTFPEGHRKRTSVAPMAQWLGEVQPGAEKAHAGGKDLPEQRSVPAAGECVGHRAVGGMADRQTLPGHERTFRTMLRGARGGRGDPHGSVEGEPALEEITETSGLDPPLDEMLRG